MRNRRHDRYALRENSHRTEDTGHYRRDEFWIAIGTGQGSARPWRIGRRHLLDLLDLDDPQHVDPAVNRIRNALSFGYPDRLSLAFNHGFVTAEITLGGLAGVVKIDALRGIPLGPIIDKMVPPSAKTEDEQ